MPLPASQPSSSPTAVQIAANDPNPGVAVAEPRIITETHRDRLRRHAHRARLHGYAVVTIALIVILAALVASNTGRVRVDWVFGSSRVPIVWMALCTAILGWLIGVFTTTLFRWRTRAPRNPRPDQIAYPTQPKEIS